MQYIPPPSLQSFLRQYTGYILLSHKNPDADCAASSLALGSFLERTGKQVRQYNKGRFDRYEVRELAPFFEQPQLSLDEARHSFMREDWGVVVLDCNNAERMGGVYELFAHLETAVIDHHLIECPFGDVCYIDSGAPSTGMLVQSVIENMGDHPTKQEALWLLLATISDTGYLRFVHNNEALILEAITRLVKCGASMKQVHTMLYSDFDLESYTLLACHLQRIQSFFDGQMLITHETAEEKELYSKYFRDTNQLYRMMLSVKGVEVIAFFREGKDGTCSVSLRSQEMVDVQAIAQVMGGGGHRLASGYERMGKFSEVCEQLLTYCTEAHVFPERNTK